jgi:ABC-type sugar transport system ATPase subunit
LLNEIFYYDIGTLRFKNLQEKTFNETIIVTKDQSGALFVQSAICRFVEKRN